MDETRNYQIQIVADNIRRLRMIKGWSQTDLASAASISSVAMYESGKRYPSPDIMAKVARALGVTVSDLTKDNDVEGTFDESKVEILGDLVSILASLDKHELSAIRSFVLAFPSQTAVAKRGAR